MQNIKLDLINFKNESENSELIPYLFKLTKQLKVTSHFKRDFENIKVSIEGNSELVQEFTKKIAIDRSIEDQIKLGEDLFKNRGICPDCVNELLDSKNRRHRYHLISCNNCSQSINYTHELPFNRGNTVFNNINQCNKCNNETFSGGRRSSFAMNSCPECGPELQLFDEEGIPIRSKDHIAKAVYLINKGEVIAVRFDSGFKFVSNKSGANNLRKITKRPLEIVFKSAEVINKYFYLSEAEKKVIEKFHAINLPVTGKPVFNHISKLNKIKCRVAANAIEILLINEAEKPYLILCDTSEPGEPPLIETTTAVRKLSAKVNYFLCYQLEQILPSAKKDYQFIDSLPIVCRPSSDYFNLKSPISILALGEENNPSLSFTTNNGTVYVPISENLKNFVSLKRYKDIFMWLLKLSGRQPNIVAVTPKPDSKILKFSEKIGSQIEYVYHNHAHAASVIAENNIDEKVIAIIFDTGGYISGGKLAGAEFLITDLTKYNRASYFEEFLMPGFEKCFEDPYRSAFSMLYQSFGNDYYPYPQLFENVNKSDLSLIKTMLEQKINCMSSNSMVLLMNGFSSIIGCKDMEKDIFYYADKSEDTQSSYFKQLNEYPQIGLKDLVKQALSDTFVKSKEEIASLVINTIINMTENCVIKLSRENGIKKVVLSGDLFEKGRILPSLIKKLENNGLSCYTNKKLPLNDFNISFGQAAVVSKRKSHFLSAA